MLEPQLFGRARHFLEVQGLGVEQAGPALDVVDFAARDELAQPSGHPGDDLVLPGAQLLQVDFGPGELDAPVAGLPGFGQDLCHVEQGFGGDAAPVEADPARVGFQVDESDLHAEVGGFEGSDVPAGAAADDCELGLVHDGRFSG